MLIVFSWVGFYPAPVLSCSGFILLRFYPAPGGYSYRFGFVFAFISYVMYFGSMRKTLEPLTSLMKTRQPSNLRLFLQDTSGAYLVIFAILLSVLSVAGGSVYDQAARATAVKSRLESCLTVAGLHGVYYFKKGFPTVRERTELFFRANCLGHLYNSELIKSGSHNGFISIKLKQKQIQLSAQAKVIPVMDFLRTNPETITPRVIIEFDSHLSP
jgi:hypothetical protein